MTISSTRLNILAVFALVAIAAGLAMFGADSASANSNARAIAVTGITSVDGEPVLVSIIAAVTEGKSDQAVAAAALKGANARAITAQEFSAIDITWDQFLDSDETNDYVVQRYNPKREPAGAKAAIEASRTTWTNAPSSFVFEAGMVDTDTCPSLVDECRGAQTFDGNNDVGWARLSDRNTLAVTWSGTEIDEADVAFNIRFNWETNGADYDIETVALHEFGHVIGLGHSVATGSIMEATYAGMRRTLTPDDIAGLQSKYGTGEPPPDPTYGSISGVVTNADGGGVIAGADVSLGTGESTITAANGTYSFASVLVGDSSVTVSADGFVTATDSTVVVENSDVVVDFVLDVQTQSMSSVESITYSGSGGKNGTKDLRVTILVHGDDAPLPNATVSITLEAPSATFTGTATTGSDGTVAFRLRNAETGLYTTIIESVEATGFDWDQVQPTANSGTHP